MTEKFPRKVCTFKMYLLQQDCNWYGITSCKLFHNYDYNLHKPYEVTMYITYNNDFKYGSDFIKLLCIQFK